MNLTKPQERAIYHKDGPMLVLAGPGSGKTFVITQRIKALIETHHVNPANILVISFTRASATEMKERFLKLTKTNHTQVVFGTFHSIFLAILKNSYTYSKDCILREEEKIRLLRRIGAKYIPEGEEKEEFFQLFFKEFQRNTFSRDEFKTIYEKYVAYLKKEGRLDFEEILNQCYELLRKYPQILKFWQNRFSYILIDEFQDINTIQFKTIELLTKPTNNLFVVGDDDQAIYGFRGSKPDIMLQFPKIHPDCKQILLDKNFRCGKSIVEHSLNLITYNQVRFEKEIAPFREENGEMEVHQFETTKPECEFIISRIRDSVANGLKYSDIAVLYRIHSSTTNLIAAFRKANIPYLLKEKIPNLFDHWICHDIFCFLRLAHKTSTRQDFIQILNKPFRGIYRSDLKLDWNSKNPEENFYKRMDKVSHKDVCQEFLHKIDFLGSLTPALAISFIQNSLGYGEHLRKHARNHNVDERDLFGILEELKQWCSDTDSYEEMLEKMEEETEALQQKPPSDYDGVSLMSFHGSKGLEFKSVYIIDCNEELTPYRKAITQEEIEEERRMFYVAVTRAKNHLILCHLERLYNKKLRPSRFLKEFLGESLDEKIESIEN